MLEGGSEPLAYAVIKNNVAIAELLLAHGADVKAVDKSGSTPLHLAADRGYAEMAALLIAKGADVNARDRAGAAPLDEAATRGYRALAEVLLDHGARVDEESPGERRDAFKYCGGERQSRGRRAPGGARGRSGAAQPLGCDATRERRPQRPSRRGRRAPGRRAAGRDRALLCEAALKNQREIADLLLRKGADVNARDSSGATPLHAAALKGNLAIAELLLSRGAKVDARDGDGLTPLHIAAVSGHAEVAALLLDRGADREARDTGAGATPLFQAAAWGRKAVVEASAQARRGRQREEPLRSLPADAAAKNGFADIARLLKERSEPRP